MPIKERDGKKGKDKSFSRKIKNKKTLEGVVL